MAIYDLMCSKCEHELVCKIMDKIMKFDDEAKSPLGVDITMVSCKSFDVVQEEE